MIDEKSVRQISLPRITVASLALGGLAVCPIAVSSAADKPMIDSPTTLNLSDKSQIIIGQKEFKVRGANHTQVFQRAIDTVSREGGGNITVPKGRYRLKNIDLKSGVKLIFDDKAVIKPVVRGRGANIFNCGLSGEMVKDVAITSASGRFTFDFTGNDVIAEETKLRAIGIGDCSSFHFGNFDVKDKFTVFSSLIFGWAGVDKERSLHGREGLIENITVRDAHYGYGAIQAHAGEAIFFNNIKSFGGVAVRLETGLIPMNRAQIGGLDQILVDGAYSINGQAALMFQPHTMQHGDITARNIVADGSEFAVSIAKPFVSKRRYKPEEGFQPGSYRSLKISGVKATYRDGPIITRFTHLKYYPEELHGEITEVTKTSSQPHFRGPSIAAVSRQDNITQTIDIQNVQAIGYKHHPDIITEEHVYVGRVKVGGATKTDKKKTRKGKKAQRNEAKKRRKEPTKSRVK